MADPLTSPGGRREVNTNEQVTSAMLNDMQRAVSKTILDLVLARVFRDDAGGEAESGFLGSDCICVRGAGALDVDVAAGVGFFHDTTESDIFDPYYKPIVVRAAFTQAVGAHSPANPRIDIICLGPSEDQDEPASVYVKSGGTVSIESLDTRTMWGYTVQVVAGTPAGSPTAPATPAGKVKIAEVLVPAVTGNVTVTDARPVLQFAAGLNKPPRGEYHHNWVPGTSTELEVTAGTYPAVNIAAGDAHINGRRYTYDGGSLNMPLVSGLYFVWLAADGTVNTALTSGYSHTDGARAGAEEDEVAAILALADVNTGASTVTVSDLRWRKPLAGLHIEDSSIDVKKLAFDVVRGNLTRSAEGVSGLTITVQAKKATADPPTDHEEVTYFLIEVCDEFMVPLTGGDWHINVTTGTAVSTVDTERLIVSTDATGEAVLPISYDGLLGAGTEIFIKCTPMNEYAGGSTYTKFTSP